MFVTMMIKLCVYGCLTQHSVTHPLTSRHTFQLTTTVVAELKLWVLKECDNMWMQPEVGKDFLIQKNTSMDI